jgi:hypothetical protein
MDLKSEFFFFRASSPSAQNFHTCVKRLIICGGVGPKRYQKMRTDDLYFGILAAVLPGQSHNFKKEKTKNKGNTGLGRRSAQAKY